MFVSAAVQVLCECVCVCVCSIFFFLGGGYRFVNVIVKSRCDYGCDGGITGA